MMVQENLNSAEVNALREVKKGIMQRVIPDHVCSRLIQKKYIEQEVGGLSLTSKGRRYLRTYKR
jgi:hypothetical protein